MSRPLPLLFAALLSLLLPLAGPALADDASSQLPRVKLVTSMGEIILQLEQEKAPETVDNFLRYARSGFYDGTIFHRVIDGFMIQGGGFTPNMLQKETRPPVRNEAENGLRNTIGSVAMARTQNPHSATAQFFINVNNNDFLDFREKTPRAWGYTVFGRVVSGMDVVKAIKDVRTTTVGYHENVPAEPIIIQQAVILDAE